MLRLLREQRTRPLLEWCGWCLLVLLLWQQTDHFSQPMSEFLFGADGWPKAVLLLLLLGATVQTADTLWKQSRIGKKRQVKRDEAGAETLFPFKDMSRYQIAAIFCLPLVYVFLMRRIGFFVATPLFVLAYLWTLEVRRWQHLVAVTSVIVALVLVVFVRFFYVALPVGSWQWAYDINNFIVAIVRAGL